MVEVFRRARDDTAAVPGYLIVMPAIRHTANRSVPCASGAAVCCRACCCPLCPLTRPAISHAP